MTKLIYLIFNLATSVVAAYIFWHLAHAQMPTSTVVWLVLYVIQFLLTPAAMLAD